MAFIYQVIALQSCCFLDCLQGAECTPGGREESVADLILIAQTLLLITEPWWFDQISQVVHKPKNGIFNVWGYIYMPICFLPIKMKIISHPLNISELGPELAHGEHTLSRREGSYMQRMSIT